MIRAAALILALVAGPVAAQNTLAARALAACGGTEIRLAAPEGTDPALLQDAGRVLNSRLGGGVLTRYVSVEDTGLTVRLPASSVDLEEFRAALARVDLGFHEISDTGRDGYSARTAPQGFDIWLKDAPLLTAADLIDADPIFDSNGAPALSFRFSPEAARIFGQFTAENIGQLFAVQLDGKILTVPVIQTAIPGGQGMITGNFTIEEVTELAAQLRSGQLPIDLTIESADEVARDPDADHSICP